LAAADDRAVRRGNSGRGCAYAFADADLACGGEGSEIGGGLGSVAHDDGCRTNRARVRDSQQQCAAREQPDAGRSPVGAVPAHGDAADGSTAATARSLTVNAGNQLANGWTVMRATATTSSPRVVMSTATPGAACWASWRA
jgi:hypothetical protein